MFFIKGSLRRFCTYGRTGFPVIRKTGTPFFWRTGLAATCRTGLPAIVRFAIIVGRSFLRDFVQHEHLGSACMKT